MLLAKFKESFFWQLSHKSEKAQWYNAQDGQPDSRCKRIRGSKHPATLYRAYWTMLCLSLMKVLTCRAGSWLAPGVHRREGWGHGPDVPVSLRSLASQKRRGRTNNEGAGLCQQWLCGPKRQNELVKRKRRKTDDENKALTPAHLMLLQNMKSQQLRRTRTAPPRWKMSGWR